MENDTIQQANPALLYVKKPIVIEALQLRWDTWSDMCGFAGVGRLEDNKPHGTSVDAVGVQFEEDGPGLFIPTLEGLVLARPFDYIIKDVRGELCPCKPDIFEETYDKFEDNSNG